MREGKKDVRLLHARREHRALAGGVKRDLFERLAAAALDDVDFSIGRPVRAYFTYGGQCLAQRQERAKRGDEM